ncbi:hypothetical protein HPB49_013057 [Dermacentor silvarum]|uniref:Uncharacterized protein n=1 Tax=Dermacentor silvarum TaxID=543639 RepID=A0ACB8CXA7_DERSI|nr:hypothetical protein HPB49_013057 [Dermacentor silvarum]
MLAGDIESNPGPTNQEVLTEIRKVAADMADLKNDNRALNESLEAIHAKLDTLANLEGRIAGVEDKIATLENTISSLALQVDDLENRSRRSNLIFYGIPEVENEKPDDLKRTISDKVSNGTIGVTISGIERMHRLGTKAENKTRPVILKLQCFEDKANIMKNCSKLKNSNISVGEDFSIRVRNIRKKLWNSSKSNRDSGEKVTLVYDKIKINGPSLRLGRT